MAEKAQDSAARPDFVTARINHVHEIMRLQEENDKVMSQELRYLESRGKWLIPINCGILYTFYKNQLRLIKAVRRIAIRKNAKLRFIHLLICGTSLGSIFFGTFVGVNSLVLQVNPVRIFRL